MSKINEYLKLIKKNIYAFLYHNTSMINSKMSKLIESETETITSPKFLNYLINNHMGEIEYSFLIKDYAYHLLEFSNSHKYISKAQFVAAIEQAYKDNELSPLAYLKTKKLRKAVSFDAFIRDHETDEFTFKKDKYEKVPVNVSAMINLLMLPWEELTTILEQSPFGLTKEEFTYIVLSYFKLESGHRYQNATSKPEMLKRYQFPGQLISNIEKLETTFDTTIIDKPIQEKPRYFDDIRVNPELWDKITSQIPEDFNNLEKAYYIYYELCKTLTYRDDFFKLGETRKQSHIGFEFKIKYLPTISTENNQVICYEIMAIYQKFLDHLGIRFDVNDGNNRGSAVRYNSHPVLNIAIDDKYLIEADATRGVIKGDMPLAKENRPLQGFKCKNNNEQVQADFKRSIDKVNNYIQEQEKQESSFFDVVNAYQEACFDVFELSDQEKLSILINSITQTDLSPTDSLAYISELTRMLFPKETCDNFFVLDHQRNFEKGSLDSVDIPALQIVLAYQAPDEEEKRYYLYSKETGLTQKTHEELQESFDKERYEYLIRYKKEIPNIVIPEKKGDSHAY